MTESRFPLTGPGEEPSYAAELGQMSADQLQAMNRALAERYPHRCLPAACTGYIDNTGNIAHDGPTCPIHE